MPLESNAGAKFVKFSNSISVQTETNYSLYWLFFLTPQKKEITDTIKFLMILYIPNIT